MTVPLGQKDYSVIDHALELAFTWHAGQKDKQGDPYILHVLRVMLEFQGDETMMAIAVLHDIVEDTFVCVGYVKSRCGAYVGSIVEILTRSDDETYFDYIERVSKNRVATLVKLADLKDNMARLDSLVRTDKGKAASLGERYRKAVGILEGAL